MSDYSKKLKAEKAKQTEADNKLRDSIHCDDCQTGYSSFAIARKLKSISGITTSIELMANGERCIQCFYCKIGKRKAKMIQKVYKNFRSLELYEKVKCPNCSSENFSRKEAHYYCGECGLID